MAEFLLTVAVFVLATALTWPRRPHGFQPDEDSEKPDLPRGPSAQSHVYQPKVLPCCAQVRDVTCMEPSVPGRYYCKEHLPRRPDVAR